MKKKKAPSRDESGVVLPAGVTGSGFLHSLLRGAVDAYPDALGRARLPADPASFKKGYADAVVRFEAARAASPDRVAIARQLTREMHALLGFRAAGHTVPLGEHLAVARDAPAMRTHDLRGTPGLRAEVPFEGRVYRGRDVATLAETLRARHMMTERAYQAVRWIVDHIEAAGGALDLSGHRFALMGAGAELAPTAMLLAAGATVLWIDPADAGRVLTSTPSLAGTLVTSDAARDLLRAPEAAASAIRAFAADGPVHIGMFAYAPGASRELRLAATMDAIARSLPPEMVRSVALFISPTIPAEAQPEDIARAQQRLEQAPPWQRALGRVRALPTPGHVVDGDATVARAIIGLQGPGYQAAQYLGKIATAESWAVHGAGLDGGPARPVTVSANVAGITNTRSLQHPLFQAGFLGAPTFQVQIFQPDTTRALNGLIVLHDLLNEAAPGSATVQAPAARDKARALLSQQVHGGVYNLPWTLENVVRTAAVMGMAMRPSVLIPKRRRR